MQNVRPTLLDKLLKKNCRKQKCIKMFESEKVCLAYIALTLIFEGKSFVFQHLSLAIVRNRILEKGFHFPILIA